MALTIDVPDQVPTEIVPKAVREEDTTLVAKVVPERLVAVIAVPLQVPTEIVPTAVREDATTLVANEVPDKEVAVIAVPFQVPVEIVPTEVKEEPTTELFKVVPVIPPLPVVATFTADITEPLIVEALHVPDVTVPTFEVPETSKVAVVRVVILPSAVKEDATTLFAKVVPERLVAVAVAETVVEVAAVT